MKAFGKLGVFKAAVDALVRDLRASERLPGVERAGRDHRVGAAAKASPGQLKYSSGGVGSPQHIGMALLAEMRTALKAQFELYRRLIQDNNIKAG